MLGYGQMETGLLLFVFSVSRFFFNVFFFLFSFLVRLLTGFFPEPHCYHVLKDVQACTVSRSGSV